MRITGRIAYLELRALFYSPVAWLVLIVFTIPPAIDFLDLLDSIRRTQSIGLQWPAPLTFSIFADPFSGVFSQLSAHMYFYIPLLTMGLVSRELSSGSIKLLLSSPVKVGQIVSGKFLAMMAFGLVLIGLVSLLVVATYLSVDSADVKFTLAGLLGLYLLICAYSAIGLFMSCLTSYQVVAAVSTFVALGALQYIGNVGQQFDFVRDLTYFLSIAGRSNEFIQGLISSKNLAYFAIVTLLFLGLSMARLQSDRESSSRGSKALRYVSLMVIALALGYATSRPALWAFYDMTAGKRQTLTAASQATLAQMREPLKITTYANLLDSNFDIAAPRARNFDLRRFEPYIRFKSDIQMQYVYYYDTGPWKELYAQNPGKSDRELAVQVAANWNFDLEDFLRPEQIRQRIDLKPEGNGVVRVAEYGGRKAWLRAVFKDNAMYASEAENTASLQRLVSKPPRIAFLAGHGERNATSEADGEYGMIGGQRDFRYALPNQGFDVETLALQGKPVPQDVDVLVIADPRLPLGGDASAVAAFVEQGGNLLLLVDASSNPELNALVEPLGVSLLQGEVLQNSSELGAQVVWADLLNSGLFDERKRVNLLTGYSVFDVKRVIMPRAVGIGHAGKLQVHPVLAASGAVLETPKAPSATTPSVPAKPLTLALGLTRPTASHEQRIMIVGSADFLSNRELKRGDVKGGNLSLALEIFKWLTYGKFPVDTTRPTPRDMQAHVDRSDITTQKIVFFAAIPSLIALLGTTLLIYRRRR